MSIKEKNSGILQGVALSLIFDPDIPQHRVSWFHGFIISHAWLWYKAEYDQKKRIDCFLISKQTLCFQFCFPNQKAHTMAQTRIAELAARIAKDTARVDEYRISNGLPTPSFAANGPIDLNLPSHEVEAARLSAIDACLELSDLLLGPISCLRPAVIILKVYVFVR
jgi:hypothetical protein